MSLLEPEWNMIRAFKLCLTVNGCIVGYLISHAFLRYNNAVHIKLCSDCKQIRFMMIDSVFIVMLND